MPSTVPVIMKMRTTPPRVAPMVRRIAISRALFFTSISTPVMMFSAVITTTMNRISRITLRSTTSAVT